jgi:hypothetical protein
MSNKTSTQLYRLIHAMSKQEKRYFKLYSSRYSKEENAHFQLYQILLKQPEYNEEELIKALEGNPISKRLSIAKTRLFEHLLKSLAAFESQKSKQSELFAILQSVEVLYKRAMYKAAWKKWHAGYKLAQRFEMAELIPQFHAWQQCLMEKENYRGHSIESIVKMGQEAEANREVLNRLHQLWQMKSKVFLRIFYQGAVDQADLDELKNEMAHLMRQKDSEASLRERFMKNHLLGAWNLIVEKYSSALHALEENQQLINDHPKLFDATPEKRMTILTNRAFVAIKSGSMHVGRRILYELSAFGEPESLEDETLRLRWFYSFYSLYFTLDNGAELSGFDEERMEADFDRYFEKLPGIRKLDLAFSRSVFHYNRHKYRQALREIHGVMNEINPQKNIHLYFAARFYYQILLWEMEKLDYLPVAWSSTRRMLQSRNYVTDEAKVLALFFGKIQRKAQGMFTEEIHSLVHQLQGLRCRPMVSFFDFEQWAIQRVKGKSMVTKAAS